MRRNILITGASSGLGAEMARQFAAKGHNLALCARRVDRLEELRSSLATSGVDIAVRGLDVNDYQAVFAVFDDLRRELGGLDRVIVNAGLGKGAPIGTGRFDVNRQTATTNFLAALAQCEAAMEIFREQGDGHLVVVSSLSAVRGMPGAMTAYAASKAGVAALAEGIRCDTLPGAIAVTTLFPGYIRSAMNEQVARRVRLMAETETGVRAMVDAIDKEVAHAVVPAWPWRPIGFLLRHAPLPVVRRWISGRPGAGDATGDAR
jgi:short-subunit dehydrogenase